MTDDRTKQAVIIGAGLGLIALFLLMKFVKGKEEREIEGKVSVTGISVVKV